MNTTIPLALVQIIESVKPVVARDVGGPAFGSRRWAGSPPPGRGSGPLTG